MLHTFKGKWITNEEYFDLLPRNVFGKQLGSEKLNPNEHKNSHILFRKKFISDADKPEAKIYISADDYYKLFLNGKFVGQGPAPAYSHRYNYNVIDVSDYIVQGENTLAVHTYYQGLINRVWQSGDNRHGFICDLEICGETAVCSDESFKTAEHSGFCETGTVGYQTQFLERYDSRAKEVGFENPDFDDSYWSFAKIKTNADYNLLCQQSRMLVFEKIMPTEVRRTDGKLFCDFGSTYVGYLEVTAKGKSGDTVTVRCGQELNGDGSVRYNLRANCDYEEEWILSGEECSISWFDYKSIRYAELILPKDCEICDIFFTARHYPFELKAKLKDEYAKDESLNRIWELCVHSQEYGVQEVIQDCMDREKGFYVGDGCYTALTNMLLTHDDSIVRKLIDDAFASSFITTGLVTCLDCSFMQEIAEYPMMLIFLVWWHYKFTNDRDYLKQNYPHIVSVLEEYRKLYETDGLLGNLDKWCVVDWPIKFQDGYDVDIKEGKVCKEKHIAINAYYYEAIKTANKIAEELGQNKYRDENEIKNAAVSAFYLPEKHMFKDGVNTDHTSITGNIFAWCFGLCPDKESEEVIMKAVEERTITSVAFFGGFAALMGFVRYDRPDLLKKALTDKNAWLRMLDEGATTTFEAWGKDEKWNTSLFHLTYSFASVFLSDENIKKLFE